jgi:glycosyltransferase involved in cell wall biosynthesis
MGNSVKVLFVVSEFYQAGTQRFTFELDRALNKNKFSVEILCILPLNSSQQFSDYYYTKHLELGTKIYFLDDINTSTEPTFWQNIKHRLSGSEMPDESQNIKHFFDQYEVISVMGEYNFPLIKKYCSAKNEKKILIHIMNSKFQFKQLYDNFSKLENYHFVSGFGEKQIKWELDKFADYQHTYFNLNFKFENEFLKFQHKKSNTPKIGIFTRIYSTKPLDPFIYAFKSLLNKIQGAELHVFGSGDPKQEGIYRYVEQLQLEPSVFFRGHQDNILKTAVEEDLDLVWLHGYHGIPGGFAGFDIATAKIPQLFWNFGCAPNTQIHECFPMFNDIEAFANDSVYLLDNPLEAELLAEKQFEYINCNFNIIKNIHIMEELFQETSKKQ